MRRRPETAGSGRAKRPADPDRPPSLRVIGTAEQLAAIVPVLERVLELKVRRPDRPSDRTEGHLLYYADILEIRADEGQ